jgi:hypothetical protein
MTIHDKAISTVEEQYVIQMTIIQQYYKEAKKNIILKGPTLPRRK